MRERGSTGAALNIEVGPARAGAARPAAVGWGALDGTDRRLIAVLIAWAVLVAVAVGSVILHEMQTLAFPVARILFEDHFLNLGIDGHIWPRDGEVLTPAFAVIFMAPVFWVHQIVYYPLADLFGSAEAITMGRLVQLILYQVGTPLLYRLLRYGNADRRVAFTFAVIYAISPFTLTRMLVCNSLTTAQFLLWSEIGRIERRPLVRAVGLIAATWSYPLAGFSAVILTAQDWWWSESDAQRRTNLRIMLATGAALALVHFGVLVLWPHAQPRLAAEVVTFDDNFNYPVFPYRLPLWLATPVKIFEIVVFIASSCVYLLVHPSALFPAIVDLVYYAGTNKGIRDHSMCLTSIGLFAILGVRAGLYAGGSPHRNRVLIGSALAATVYGFALAGPHGLIALALAPDPPRPHLADLAPCVPPGQPRCAVMPDLYAGVYGHCGELTTYAPADLEHLPVPPADTIVFVAPERLNENPKGRPYDTPERIRAIRQALAARIRAGELHASLCAPGLVLVRAPGTGPSDPAALTLLDPPAP